MHSKIWYMQSQRDPPQTERYTQTKSKRIEKVFHANGKGKHAGVAILISNKINFKTQAILRDKEAYYIMIKGTIQQKDTALVNILHAPYIGAPKYVKHKGRDHVQGF